MEDELGLGEDSSHDMCDVDKQRTDVGTTNLLHDTKQESAQGSAHEGVYGPWVVVAKRKNGIKSHRSGGPSVENRNGFGFKSNDNVEATQRIWYREHEDRIDKPSRPPRESKRKLSPIRLVDKAQLERFIQRIGSGPTSEVQFGLAQNPSLSEPIFSLTRAATAQALLKPNSVKGKKGITRARASQVLQAGAAEVAGVKVSSIQLNKGIVMHEGIGVEFSMKPPKSRNASQCQRGTVAVSRVGDQLGGRSGNTEDDPCELPSKPSANCGLFQCQLQASNETNTFFQATSGC
nr:hypothetical protein CFP56_35784 [Quercus suber]